MTTILVNTTTSESSPMRLNLRLDTIITISASEAARLVNQKIITELGTGLIARSPELLVQEKQMIWRVPIILSLPELGDLGQVGTVEISAETGAILTDSTTQEKIRQHATRLYAGSTL